MRIFFFLLLILHGLIHLLGFVKAFNLAQVQELTMSVSKPAGMIWFLVTLMLVAGAVLYLIDINIWWMIGSVGIILSQVLIIFAWSDAKYGSIANIIILIILLPAAGNYFFNSMVVKERKELLINSVTPSAKIILPEDIVHLPPIVQKWMTNSGVVGKPHVTFGRLKQKGEMKTSPEGRWMDFTAEQYFDLINPSFIWTADVEMMPLIYLNGRDKLKDGEGEMLIKLLSLVNVVDVGHNNKINSGAMIRYLAEICWFPSAALNDYLSWKEIDSLSAEATMKLNDRSVSGIFRFNDNGEMISFEADRYYGGGEDAKLERWVIETVENREIDGYIIPVKSKVIWELEEGDYNWLNLEITDLNVNKLELYK